MSLICAYCDPDCDGAFLGTDIACGACRGVANMACPACDCPLCWPGGDREYLAHWLQSPGPLFEAREVYLGERVNGIGYVTRKRPGFPVEQLDPRTDLRNHSPTGLEWGYSGSGPAQLALAMLADLACDRIALAFYQLFEHDVIAGLGKTRFTLTAKKVVGWLDKQAKLPERPE